MAFQWFGGCLSLSSLYNNFGRVEEIEHHWSSWSIFEVKYQADFFKTIIHLALESEENFLHEVSAISIIIDVESGPKKLHSYMGVIISQFIKV